MRAGGLHALEHHVKGLADDHEHARQLAEAIDGIEGLELARPPETNIVIFDVPSARDAIAELLELGVHVGSVGAGPVGRSSVR